MCDIIIGTLGEGRLSIEAATSTFRVSLRGTAGLTPKIRTTPSAKKEGAIIDIISRVEAFEGGSDGVREKRQTVHAAVQVVMEILSGTKA
ncbi:hypothetical protein D4S03_07230 [bacterium]|nr:MAG: hypothetical protein D4S03_07230 [bacterium]